MSTERWRGAGNRMTDEVQRRAGRTVAVLFALALAGCAGESVPGGQDTANPPPPQESSVPARQDTPPAPASVADLFPPGEGRELVLNTCANCHAVACAAMGQRSDARWRELEEAHREHVPNLSDQDRQRIFTYLRTHFNDRQPEPHIPPEFLDRGCTPF